MEKNSGHSYCEYFRYSIFMNNGDLSFRIKPFGTFGEKEDMFAMCSDRTGSDLRASCGPAASKADDMIFNRHYDHALRFSSNAGLRLHYDFSRECYTFTAGDTVSVSLLENVYAKKFGIPYRPINKKSTFSAPPAGWMTWYAVKFGACEEAVLENARLQRELFGDYGADTIWVDREWYHAALTDEHPSPMWISSIPIRKNIQTDLLMSRTVSAEKASFRPCG